MNDTFLLILYYENSSKIENVSYNKPSRYNKMQ